MPPPCTSTAPIFLPSDLLMTVGFNFFQNVGGRDHQLVEPEITGADAQAEPEQLGDINNRDLIILPGLPVDVLLPQIKINLAHGATDRDAIGAHAGGHVND